MSGFDVTVNCTTCRQTLVLSAQDLRAAFTCPRCGHVMAATELVRHSMPLRAVPAVAVGAAELAATQAAWAPPYQLPAPPVSGAWSPPNHAAAAVVPPVPAIAPPLPALGTQVAGNAHWPGPYPPQPNPVPQVPAPPIRKPRRSIAGALAAALGDAAWWLDRVAYGRRLLCLSIAGATVLAIKHFVVEAYVVALFAYSSFLYLLLLARFWWIRDERGDWTWKKFAERSIGSTTDAAAGLFRAEEFSLQNLLEQLQLVLLASGLALAVLAPPLGALARWLFSTGTLSEFLTTLETLGQLLFVLGLIPWLLKQLQRRSAAAKAFKQAATALRSQSVDAVPLIIDLRQPSTWAGIPANFEPLLGTLARWKPRAQEREAGYERSLVRFLERNVPGIDAQTQLPFEAEDGTRGRIDIVLDDVVAIELKRDLRLSADADRAVGQVLKYAASWRKGPVMLLLCEASPEVADLPVLKRLAELRESGHSLFVVAAGRWGSR